MKLGLKARAQRARAAKALRARHTLACVTEAYRKFNDRQEKKS
jgi:hypothetical protein